MGMSVDHMNTIISILPRFPIIPLIEMDEYPEVEEHSSD